MGKPSDWGDFLNAIGSNQKDDATAAMQDMARSIKRKNVRDTAAFLSMPVPAYIQDQVNSEQARSRAETAAYRDRLAAEAHMHPLDRPSLDHSCNPNLSVYEWMRERGD
jgi:hypothetical protein